MAQQLREHVLHLLPGGRFHAQPQIGRLAVGAADAELLHFKTAVRFDDLVEDLLHDVGIDQVAFGLDDFLKWHETTSLLVAARDVPIGACGREARGATPEN